MKSMKTLKTMTTMTTMTTMKTHSLPLVVVAGLLHGGCVTYLTEDNVKAQYAESERVHFFSFFRDQAFKIKDAGACGRAARYFEEHFVRSEDNSTRFGNDDLKALDARIKAEARTLTDSCLAEQAPPLQKGRRFERLSELFRNLSKLPLPADEQQALALRSDTIDLLRAEATAADAQQAWDAGKVYDALSGFQTAQSIAAAVKAATDEQKAKYAKLLDERTRQHIADMVQKATASERDPKTLHLAVVYLARAWDVGRDAAIGRTLETLRQQMLTSSAYQWNVELKGEPLITKAVQGALKSHSFTGNLKAGAPREFAAVVDVGTFTMTPSEREGSRTGEYKTGSKSVDNPEYRKLTELLQLRERCMSSSHKGYRPFGASFSCDQVHRDGCRQCGNGEFAIKENRAERDQVSARLKREPMTVQEDLMSPWSYPTREWSQVIKAPVELSLKHALDSAPTSSTMTLQHEYTDHAHELVPQLGLGKKQITKQSDAELADSAGQKLAAKVITEIEKDYQTWLKNLPKLGDRGAVLFILMNADSAVVDAQLEQKTGVRNAHSVIRAR
jgi:hypothetical protein